MHFLQFAELMQQGTAIPEIGIMTIFSKWSNALVKAPQVSERQSWDLNLGLQLKPRYPFHYSRDFAGPGCPEFLSG